MERNLQQKPTPEDPQLLGLVRKGKSNEAVEEEMEALTLGSSCSRACRCQRLHSAGEQDRGIITAFITLFIQTDHLLNVMPVYTLINVFTGSMFRF